jgi:phosphoribosylaminoimidazolecarboxamide formyltransferase/IMP cyclohydrolase
MRPSLEETKIERALISVFDKTQLVEFAQAIQNCGIEIVSTGKTARELRNNSVPVLNVDEFTNSPEMLGGRVKTLHPKIHGGILFIRDDADHRKDVSKNRIQPIDLVVINLYPFAETVSQPGVQKAQAIEQIDVGGPAMIRSAAKNHRFVTVVVDVADYGVVAEHLRTKNGRTTPELRAYLAAKAFDLTSAYDRIVADYLKSRNLLK